MSVSSDDGDDFYGSDAESVESGHDEPAPAQPSGASSAARGHGKASSAPRVFPAPFGDDALAYVGNNYTVLGRQVRRRPSLLSGGAQGEIVRLECRPLQPDLAPRPTVSPVQVSYDVFGAQDLEDQLDAVSPVARNAAVSAVE